MEYIIFLLTIQLPFLYLIWKMADKKADNLTKNLQILKKQNEHIANFMDTLRMSIEKISEDVYGNGKVNSRMFELEKEMKTIKKRFHQMELYTGLDTKHSSIEDISASSQLVDKDFS